MNIVEIRNPAQFAALRDVWNGLLRQSASDSIFLTWEWLRAWWTAYGSAGELRVFLIEDAGEAIGIAPLRMATVRWYGRSYSTLRFIGDGSADSDYLDFIIAAGRERPVLEALFAHLEREFSAGLLFELNEIPDTSPNLPVLLELTSARNMISAASDSPCAVVTLPGNWAEYLQSLAPRFRTKIRSVLRNLEARQDVRFGFGAGRSELARLLPSLYDLHARRWAKDGKRGVFDWDRKRIFYETLSPLLLDAGSLRFCFLEWKGQVLACQYGFIHGNRYFQLQEGYEPACEHWNAGVGLRAWSIQRFLENGISEYDFLGGVSRHKSDWGAQPKLSKRLVLGGRTAANILFCRGPEWVSRARRTAKRVVPESWIAARDRRREERRRAALAAETDLNGGWTRHLVSACYYYSGAPAVLRPVRERYKLANTGRLRLERRRCPSVRIVYYHRVNAEGDRFFPAIAPAKFEEQIRYFARGHRVVSLTEAVRRLAQGGPPEPVVAVTFDDGYEDNYHFAVPILERYGVPATIFLTTGSLDSRALLWFERLALALKQSPHKSIDVELEMPRRFSLASPEDRLAANHRIYRFLRSLTDEERQDRLCDLIRLIGGCNESERAGRMLAWDQVRALARRGIRFGGHTVTHPFVSRLTPDRALWEATECKRRIEAETQIPVEHFAYPSGREMDFSVWNKQVIQAAGYNAAVTTLWGVNYPDTDRMELRRGQPWEPAHASFAAKFDWYEWAGI